MFASCINWLICVYELYFFYFWVLNNFLSTQIRRAVLTTMLAAPMVVFKGRLGPSAHALWVINSVMTLKHVTMLMSVVLLDSVASTALMREAPSAATARMVTPSKQTSVPAKPQVSRDI